MHFVLKRGRERNSELEIAFFEERLISEEENRLISEERREKSV